MKKDFLNVSPDTGGGSGTVTVTADPNLSATARSTTLNFNSAGQVLKAVTANQMGMPYLHYPVFNYRLEQKTALDPCTGTVTATNFWQNDLGYLNFSLDATFTGCNEQNSTFNVGTQIWISNTLLTNDRSPYVEYRENGNGNWYDEPMDYIGTENGYTHFNWAQGAYDLASFPTVFEWRVFIADNTGGGNRIPIMSFGLNKRLS